MNAIESADVREAVRRSGWLAVLETLASEKLSDALRRPGQHVACPVHGGRHGDGFRLFPDVNRSGGGICATCGVYPDGFALLRWLFGWSFPQVLSQVAGVLGIDHQRRRSLPAMLVASQKGQTDRSQFPRDSVRWHRVWSEALRPDHPGAAPLRRYLFQRGLDAGVLNPAAIRFHPGLLYWHPSANGRPICLGRFPAMLALVCAPDGSALTVHRTYLQSNGDGKAEVPAPRKLMALGQQRSLVGSAVRLFPIDTENTGVLGLAEGIETAMAARAMTGMPVWAALSASMLERFQPPSDIRRLVVWADKDRSGIGELAARALQRRLSPSVEVRIRLPLVPIPPQARGVDWADVWQRSLTETRLAA